ncbi:MAG TPA: GWxTD domain-containing protein [Terriglobales bacterium]|nr:GWxTD domain-containing protein [Terriglobales bacterium]
MRLGNGFGVGVLVLAGNLTLLAQTPPAPATKPPATQSATPGQQTQAAPPPQHALSAKQRRAQQKALEKELNPEDKKWLNEDVAYIISDEERQSFLQLTNEDEREAFIEAFWQRRNPDPESSFNQYKEDYYQRFAYANQHFAAGVPGWKTDRGRIYITWGKPDEQDNHDAGGAYDRPIEEGGGSTSTYPFEDWTYNYLEGIGSDIHLEFVDTCQCGEFHLTTDPGEKDALLHVPGAGLTIGEAMGTANKDDRFKQANGTTLGTDAYLPESQNEFNRLDTYAKIFAPPKVKFSDLSEIIDHNINYSLLPFQFRTDFVKITDDTVLVPITISVAERNMTMKQSNDVDQAKIEVSGRISTITGKIVDRWENELDQNIPAELLSDSASKSSRYWHGALLKPGRYKVNLVLKDANAPDKLGTKEYAITVPQYKDDQLASSSIILADDISKVPAKNVGSGQFVLGDTKVMPVMGGLGSPAVFKQSGSLGIWMQIYNLQTDKITHKPSATINYNIENLATLKSVLDHTEDSADIANAADELTIEKTLPLASLPPSTYRLTITITDKLSTQKITPQTSFIILQ